VQKELLQATAECTRVFIHYLVNAANDICHDNKRQNLSAEDVLKALEEAEFSEYQEPIRQMLERALLLPPQFDSLLTIAGVTRPTNFAVHAGSREDAAVKAGKKSSKKRKAIEAELDNNNNVPAATGDRPIPISSLQPDT
jgi:DNA polymerase epsilon subunit 3